MPLNFEKPRVRRIPIVQKVGSLFFKLLALIRPETVLGIFLIVAIFLAFRQNNATGFYIVFGIFVIGYFAERIIIKIWRHKLFLKQSEK